MDRWVENSIPILFRQFIAPRSEDLGTPYIQATAATGVFPARSWRTAVSYSSVRRPGRPSSFPFVPALAIPAMSAF